MLAEGTYVRVPFKLITRPSFNMAGHYGSHRLRSSSSKCIRNESMLYYRRHHQRPKLRCIYMIRGRHTKLKRAIPPSTLLKSCYFHGLSCGRLFLQNMALFFLSLSKKGNTSSCVAIRVVCIRRRPMQAIVYMHVSHKFRVTKHEMVRHLYPRKGGRY